MMIWVEKLLIKYLQMFFSSEVGTKMLDSCKKGTAIINIVPADIKKLLIPILPAEKIIKLIEKHQEVMNKMEGIYNLYIPLCGLLTAIICNVVFFHKERAKNKETAIFARVLIYSLVDSILMVSIICLALFSSNSIKLMEFLNKVDYAMYILFSSNLFLYVYYVTSKDDDTQKAKLYSFFFWLTTILDIILMILLLFMKVDVHIEGNAMYSDGIALTTTIIGCGFYFLSGSAV